MNAGIPIFNGGTVTGNLYVQGTTTTIDTVNTLIEDPIVTLADGQTSGTPTVDIGLLGLRGSQNSSFLGWIENDKEFAAVLTNTISSNTTVALTQYGNFHANNITASGNLSVTGNIVGNISFSGNIQAGNLLTSGLVSATANVQAGNIRTAGLISATGTIMGGNTTVTGFANVTSTIQGGAGLTIAGAASGITTLATGNTTVDKAIADPTPTAAPAAAPAAPVQLVAQAPAPS